MSTGFTSVGGCGAMKRRCQSKLGEAKLVIPSDWTERGNQP